MSATNIVKISEEINGFHVYVPENLDVEATLPVENRNWSDYVRYVVSTINQRIVFERLDPDGHVPLMSALLKRVLPWRDYKKILDLMVRCSIIERQNGYQVGKFSKSFRLTDQYRGQIHRRCALTNKSLCEKLAKLKRDMQRAIILPVHRHLWHWLKQVQFYFPGDVSQLSTFSSQAEQLLCKDFFFSVCAFGNRVHTNVTNLKTEYRNYLSYQGEELSNLDIANSQPLFLGVLLLNYYLQPSSANLSSVYSFDTKDLSLTNAEILLPIFNLNKKETRGEAPIPPLCGDIDPHQGGIEEETPKGFALDSKDYPIPEDLKRYLHVCSRGRLYEDLMTLLGTQDRSKAKEDFFTYLFARSSLEKYLPIAHVIEAEFPSLARAVRTMKVRDHKAVACLLQRTESEFMINRVARRMMNEYPSVPLLTIHDSVLTPTADVDLVKRVMYREFAMLGLRPRLKTERLVPPSQALAG